MDISNNIMSWKHKFQQLLDLYLFAALGQSAAWRNLSEEKNSKFTGKNIIV